jgi:hypothetical protein
MGIGLWPPLHLPDLFSDPAMLFFNKIIDQSGRGFQGGTDNDAGFGSNDERDGPAAGADDLVDVNFVHGRIRLFYTSLGE